MADSPDISRPASEKSGTEPTKPDTAFNPDWRFVVAFCSLSIITLMAALDATSISVALPIMAQLLRGTALEAFWSGTSFLLTSTVFQPVIGSFSSIFGRKPMIYTSLVLFGIGAIVAAVAKNFAVILVGRSIQGIGGGGIIIMTEIVATDMVPLRERGKWFSFISSMWALGTVIGPLLGGGFAQNASWTWIFWINLPFIAIGGLMITLFLTLNYKTSSFVKKLARVDWIGAVVFIGATTGFLIPITWGGVMYPWSHWRTLVPLILCAVALIAFVAYEEWLTRIGREPIIRTSVFKNRTSAVTFFTTVIHGIVLWSILYYLPLYYEAVKEFSPILAGVALFPQTFTVAPASVVAGVLIAVTGKYRNITWFGWATTTVGMGLLILLKASTSTPGWIFLNLVSGVGTGVLFSAMAIAVQAASSNEDMAHSVTMFAFFRAAGQTFGVAISGTIFQNQMKKELLKHPLLAENASNWSQDAAGLVQIIKQMPAGLAKDQLKDSYVGALKYVWIVMTVLAFVAFVVSLGTEALPLDRELVTEQGFQYKKKKGDEETKEVKD
ncbi:MFS general substrate transporter [Tothia fuscella]|uniref:MFS general substrate transporter n=1 Tax=Tothia fuscella TaxID=1048955 RepID=A0A9P4U539_9PEZI|nr:MFS general substrate transporter [Tothia fuscella]